jgi:hypothetical protein
MLKAILDWILRNATFRLYNCAEPIGTRLGGHDIPGQVDTYIILDVRAGSRILILGWFQAS